MTQDQILAVYLWTLLAIPVWHVVVSVALARGWPLPFCDDEFDARFAANFFIAGWPAVIVCVALWAVFYKLPAWLAKPRPKRVDAPTPAPKPSPAPPPEPYRSAAASCITCGQALPERNNAA